MWGHGFNYRVQVVVDQRCARSPQSHSRHRAVATASPTRAIRRDSDRDAMAMRFLNPQSDFTYAAPDDAAWRRAVIHGLEQLTGKPRLWRPSADYCRAPAGRDFFAAAVDRLGLPLALDRRAPPPIPPPGPPGGAATP